MIRKSLIFCFLFLSIEAYNQSYFTKELSSEFLDIKRTLRISLPTNYHQDSSKTYPLAVVLNGEYLFDVYIGNAKLYSNNKKAPEQIVGASLEFP